MRGKIKVHSIFESISGESGFFPQGTWCTFIRMQGCNFFPEPCDYCDTIQAQDGVEGEWMEIEDIHKRIHQHHVLITGGEPLMQKEALHSLIAYLLKHTSCEIQIETNGSITIPGSMICNSRVGWVLDYKLLSSGMMGKMLSLDTFTNILSNSPNNYLKFVVANLDDLFQTINVCEKLIERKIFRSNFIISPINAQGSMIPDIAHSIKKLSPMLLKYIIFSTQLHKLVDLP